MTSITVERIEHPEPKRAYFPNAYCVVIDGSIRDGVFAYEDYANDRAQYLRDNPKEVNKLVTAHRIRELAQS